VTLVSGVVLSCHRLARNDGLSAGTAARTGTSIFHGKEGVIGSSPMEGSDKPPAYRAVFAFLGPLASVDTHAVATELTTYDLMRPTDGARPPRPGRG